MGACSSRPASAKRSPAVKVQAVFVRAPPMRGDDFYPDEQGSKSAASKSAQFASAAYKANGKTAVIVGGSQVNSCCAATGSAMQLYVVLRDKYSARAVLMLL